MNHEIAQKLRALADCAYSKYIDLMRSSECLGKKIKMEQGSFGDAELKAHCAAAEMLGRHYALHGAASMLCEALESSVETADK